MSWIIKYYTALVIISAMVSLAIVANVAVTRWGEIRAERKGKNEIEDAKGTENKDKKDDAAIGKKVVAESVNTSPSIIVAPEYKDKQNVQSFDDPDESIADYPNPYISKKFKSISTEKDLPEISNSPEQEGEVF